MIVHEHILSQCSSLCGFQGEENFNATSAPSIDPLLLVTWKHTYKKVLLCEKLDLSSEIYTKIKEYPF